MSFIDVYAILFSKGGYAYELSMVYLAVNEQAFLFWPLTKALFTMFKYKENLYEYT